MRVGVTGASGFVGRAVCNSLAANGAEVIALTRRPGTAPPSAREERVTGDLERVNMSGYLDGIQVIVHLAARVHQMQTAGSSPDAYMHTNRDVTVRLASAALQSGAKRFVYMSTLKVNGESTQPGASLTEESPAHPMDPYAWSKWDAERQLADLAKTSSLEVVVIRPPLVYGPGVKANFLALMRAVDRHVPLPFRQVHNRRSLVYVGNLASAITAAANRSAAVGRTYFVTDGEDLSTSQLIQQLGAALDRSVILLPVPTKWLQAAGRLTGRSAAVHRLTSSFQADSTKIRRELGWMPPFSARDGFRETAQWFREWSA